MSEIKVNSIKGVAASAAAITVNNTDGTCTANITNNLSNRNLIINGAMQVAQRGTSNTTHGYGTVDRYYMGYSGTDEAPTQSQIDIGTSDTPYTLGFRKAFRVTNGNQTSGAGAADYIFMNYSIEAQDLANSGWNYTSSSSNITLSFWIRSSVAQNFFLQFHTRDGTERVYTFETGALTADTWTKVTKTFPGSSLITIDNDNGQGAIITMNYFFGQNYTNSDGSAASNVWRSYGDSVKSADQTTTWYTTNDATLDLVGFQLEVGSVATDFEHRSFAQELKLCERYFEKSYNHSVVPGTATDAGLVMWLANRNPGLPHVSLRFKTSKRANPTVTIYNTNVADSNTLRDKDASANLTPAVNRLGTEGGTVYTSTSVALGNFLAYHYTAESEL